MSKEIFLKCYFDKEKVRSQLKEYIYSEDESFNEFILSYLDKWIWIYFCEESGYNYLNVKFSKHFLSNEIQLFVKELESLGYAIDEF